MSVNIPDELEKIAEIGHTLIGHREDLMEAARLLRLKGEKTQQIYKDVTTTKPPHASLVTKQQSQGWELVTIIPVTSRSGAIYYTEYISYYRKIV